MNRKWWLLPLAIAVALPLVWFASGPEQRAAVTSALGLQPAPVAAQRQKPICSQAIVPTGADCIPQHLAHLPPDPGEAGKLTIDGIDSDKDGVRDDVQRYIMDNWGHSQRAVKVLTELAKAKQMQVHYGDELGKEETRKLMPKIMSSSICYSRTETPEMMRTGAFDSVLIKVTNTPERWKRAADFDYQLAHNVYDLPDISVADACGFDPTTLPN
ncbi:MAG TPA: hypothetical protein VES94_06210 [Burkholderiales bacterium]|nr:hypothetical protein [Burkholderiales bacterium]